jgi:hypothetical protein
MKFSFYFSSQINDPPPEVIIQRLNEHPYIDFRDNLPEQITNA